MSGQPLVTVLMPVRNGGALLADAVQSIRLQSYSNWELLVMDDGSDDGAVAHLQTLHDSRIRIVQAPCSLGIAARLNQGVGLARGEFLARMDADDVAFPERLTRQVEVLLADDHLDLVGASAVTMDVQGRLTGNFPRQLTHKQLCARPWQGFHLVHPTWMGRMAWFRAHPYAEPAPYACEDQDLLLRTYGDSRFACTDEVLLAYRLRDRVDWEKLAQTRFAWWRCQVRQFSGKAQWCFLALSCVCYALRRLRDRWIRLRGSHVFGMDASQIDPVVMRQWSELRARLVCSRVAQHAGSSPDAEC